MSAGSSSGLRLGRVVRGWACAGLVAGRNPDREDRGQGEDGRAGEHPMRSEGFITFPRRNGECPGGVKDVDCNSSGSLSGQSRAGTARPAPVPGDGSCPAPGQVEDALDQPIGEVIAGAEGLGGEAGLHEVDRVPPLSEGLQVVGDRHVGPVDEASRLGLTDQLRRARPGTGA